MLEVTEKIVAERNERNSTALNGDCLTFKICFMNSINISKQRLSICHKDTCINVKGNIAKTVVFGLAAIVVVNAITSVLESSN